MRLKGHFDGAEGLTPLVNPSIAPVAHLHLDMLVLAPGQSYVVASGDFEAGLIVLTGTCVFTLDGTPTGELGGRATVFDGRASAVYAPPGTTVGVQAASTRVEIALCRCRARGHHASRVVRPADVVARKVGGTGFTRYVHDVLGTQMAAERLIVGETFTPQGNWSSFPPHKHDVEAPPDEVRQEEVYLYRIRPQNGFGLQYLYSKPESRRGTLDLPLAVRENDFTLMPFGYHPVAAPPGYDLYYLWFLAGESRAMHPHDDSSHVWVKAADLALRTYPD